MWTDKTPATGELNGIPFKKWTPPTDWSKVEGQKKIKEPPFHANGLRPAAGVIVMEPDGRVWIMEPKNHFVGTEHGFPKGGVEDGDTLQSTAIKEAWEETGLKVDILGYLGDIKRTTSVARYYMAKRTGGSPNSFGWETNSVKLVPLNEVERYLTWDVDRQFVTKIKAAVEKSSKPIDKIETSSNDSSKSSSTASNIMATKTGGPKGSNAGGFYTGKDGKKRYVKVYHDPTQAYSENLTNQIYKGLGLPAPESSTFENDGKTMYASDIIEGETLEKRGLNKSFAQRILRGFAADVLTANWDSVGLTMDNILIDKDGQPNRIDNGGSFLFRAQAGKKPESLLNKITEWDGFSNPDINQSYSEVFQDAGYRNADAMGKLVVDQIKTILQFQKNVGGWDTYVNKTAKGLNTFDKKQIIDMLNARTLLLAKKSKSLE